MVLLVARLMFSREDECFEDDIAFKEVDTISWFLSMLVDGGGWIWESIRQG